MEDFLVAQHSHAFPKNIEINDLDPDEGNQKLCKACTLPIFSTPFDDENINFPLHKDCANLPNLLKGHFLHPNKPLDLRKVHDDRMYRCAMCNMTCKGFIYCCPDPGCAFALDVLCAMPTGTVKVMHRSHEHELVPITAEVLVPCAACEQNHQGPSYLCYACSFWIHQKCALLPNKIKCTKDHNDQHILILTYSSSTSSSPECAICQRQIFSWGSYICTGCEYAAHVKCAASDQGSFSLTMTEDSGGLIHLPMVDEQTSLVHYLLQNTTSSKSTEEEEEGQQQQHQQDPIKRKHEHPLIYHDHTSMYIKDEEDHKYRLCNGCISPISLPFYSCPECSDFFLHSFCANLPLKFQPQCFGAHEPHVLHLRSDDKLLSSFRCTMCDSVCNGFLYTDTMYLDVECTFLPKYVTHEAHPKSHILFLANLYYNSSIPSDQCGCCGKGFPNSWYECSICHRFKIHIRCAKLPKSITHKFDNHPLKLTYTKSSSTSLPPTQLEDERFCEICEDNINTKLWYYGCHECNNWFHIDCIPSVGNLSKIKFGGTISVQGHDCPLTSIRLLTEYSQRCGFCKKFIQGFVDEVAFECSKCDFRVHHRCLILRKENRSITSYLL